MKCGSIQELSLVKLKKLRKIKMRKMELEFGDELRAILKKYKQSIDEPLDGDEVEVLGEIIKKVLNLIEGNITEKEYLKSF
jgi:hypothetical protein